MKFSTLGGFIAACALIVSASASAELAQRLNPNDAEFGRLASTVNHAVSGDARYVVMNTLWSGYPKVVLVDRLSQTSKQIDYDENKTWEAGSAPDISQDGQRIVFTGGGSSYIYLYDQRLGYAKRMGNDRSYKAVKISPDGKTVAFVEPDERHITLVDIDTGGRRTVEYISSDIYSTIRNLNISNSGKIVTYGTSGPKEGGVHVYNTETGKEVALDGGLVPDISADGRWVVYSEYAATYCTHEDEWQEIVCSSPTRAGAFLYDAKTGVSKLISGVAKYSYLDENYYAWGHSISPDGRYIAFGGRGCGTWVDGEWECSLVYDRELSSPSCIGSQLLCATKLFYAHGGQDYRGWMSYWESLPSYQISNDGFLVKPHSNKETSETHLYGTWAPNGKIIDAWITPNINKNTRHFEPVL